MKEEHWLKMWKDYLDFLKEHKRRPSKYVGEDRTLVNWLKYNRKIRNKGLLNEERSKLLDVLLAEADKYRRVNQHQYLHRDDLKKEIRNMN